MECSPSKGRRNRRFGQPSVRRSPPTLFCRARRWRRESRFWARFVSVPCLWSPVRRLRLWCWAVRSRLLRSREGATVTIRHLDGKWELRRHVAFGDICLAGWRASGRWAVLAPARRCRLIGEGVEALRKHFAESSRCVELLVKSPR